MGSKTTVRSSAGSVGDGSGSGPQDDHRSQIEKEWPEDGLYGTVEIPLPANAEGLVRRIRVSPGGKSVQVFNGDENTGPGELETHLWGINYMEVRNLLGQLLTHIDATFADPVQRECQKDLIRQMIGRWADDQQASAVYDAYGPHYGRAQMEMGPRGAIPGDPRKEYGG